MASSKKYDPDKTRGAKAARKIREKLNNASDEERDRLFNLGMSMIYGGGEKVRSSRH